MYPQNEHTHIYTYIYLYLYIFGTLRGSPKHNNILDVHGEYECYQSRLVCFSPAMVRFNKNNATNFMSQTATYSLIYYYTRFSFEAILQWPVAFPYTAIQIFAMLPTLLVLLASTAATSVYSSYGSSSLVVPSSFVLVFGCCLICC